MTKTLLSAISLLVLTIIHHIYGAAIYATPWRHHVALIALPVILILIFTYGIYRWNPSSFVSRISMWIFIALTFLIPVGWIGLFEGGYNHVIKNALFFAKVPQSILEQLFPPPTYELPNDLWFEITGSLQFFVGFYTAYCLFRLWKDKPYGWKPKGK